MSRISISTVAYSFMFVHLQSLPSSVLLELLEQIIAKLTTKAIYKKKKKKINFCCSIWFLQRWAQLHSSKMITCLKISTKPSNTASFLLRGNFVIFALCFVGEVRQTEWNLAIHLASVGLTKVLQWWEAGNKVTAPHIVKTGEKMKDREGEMESKVT